MFIIKFAFYFVLSFFILCIPVAKQSLFYHISEVTSPITHNLFSYLGEEAKAGLKKGKKMTRKFFGNSAPDKVQDKVKVNHSSLQKNLEIDFGEKYTDEEKDMLSKMLE